MAGTPQTYTVLARKYRPQAFGDLIGQEAMVRTLTNAFSMGRIAHAFMLTGVRGVGKTTTARLLARALNYARDDQDATGPSIVLDPPGVHCAAITAGQHPDVMEMDAASRTGVGDVREILEGVRYAATSARFKVYIIDEVHMLSTAAFNALLKTLEEPPAHVKFIFATTEIRKVPVTVLSRCQRFDLKRVEPEVLVSHLAGIAKREGAGVADDALKLIARAAEGSVRDALSLLDQAIVQRTDGQAGDVDVHSVRTMLGLADRGRTFGLFTAAVRGEASAVLAILDELYAGGGDPAVTVRDVMDHCHDVTRAKALGEAARFSEASDHVARIHDLAGSVSMGVLARVWQMLLKAHEEVRAAPDAAAAAEMALLRIAYAAGLPSPEDAARLLAGAETSTAGGPAASGQSERARPQTTASAPPQARPTANTDRPAASAPDRPSGMAARVAASRGGARPALKIVPPEPREADAVTQPKPAESAPPEPPPVEAYEDSYGIAEPYGADERDGPPFDAAAPYDAVPPEEDALSTQPRTLPQIAQLAERQRDLLLKSNIERFARPIRVEIGRVEIALVDSPHCPPDLANQLASKLQAWTGLRWLVRTGPEGEGGETIAEARERERAALWQAAASGPLVHKAMQLWPGAAIISVREVDGPDEDKPEQTG